jgi:hypothetical protein
MTHVSCKAITIDVLPDLKSGKLKEVSVFQIYFPGMKSQEYGGITDFENHCTISQAAPPFHGSAVSVAYNSMAELTGRNVFLEG